mgnify:CR=1 FL=1|tara:strand:- start:295 stop:633 length:339 start_codon:yes stop_codon:yes gene_type:complete
MSRKKQLESLLEGLDPGSEKYEELKELLDAEMFQGNLNEDEVAFIEQAGKKLMADGGMAVRPTNKQVRKFAGGGALMGHMIARHNRADRETKGMVSRGGGAATQGIKFRGVK